MNLSIPNTNIAVCIVYYIIPTQQTAACFIRSDRNTFGLFLIEETYFLFCFLFITKTLNPFIDSLLNLSCYSDSPIFLRISPSMHTNRVLLCPYLSQNWRSTLPVICINRMINNPLLQPLYFVNTTKHILPLLWFFIDLIFIKLELLFMIFLIAQVIREALNLNLIFFINFGAHWNQSQLFGDVTVKDNNSKIILSRMFLIFYLFVLFWKVNDTSFKNVSLVLYDVKQKINTTGILTCRFLVNIMSSSQNNILLYDKSSTVSTICITEFRVQISNCRERLFVWSQTKFSLISTFNQNDLIRAHRYWWSFQHFNNFFIFLFVRLRILLLFDRYLFTIFWFLFFCGKPVSYSAQEGHVL